VNTVLAQPMPLEQRPAGSLGLFALLYPCLIFIAWWFGAGMMGMAYEKQFWIVTLLVLGHNLFELVNLFRTNSKLYFLQPVVLGALVIFIIQLGGVTNFLMTRDGGGFAYLYNTNIEKDPYWLVLAMSVILLASVSYWLGYKLSAGRILFNLYFQGYKRFINYSVSTYALIAGWVVGCFIKLLINYYGGIGHKFIVLIQAQGEIPAVVSRLKVFENLSLLFLMMILFEVYRKGRNPLLTNIVIIGTIFEIVFAVTSGARGPIVYLLLSFFMVDYYFHRRIKLLYILVFGLVLYGSMTLLVKYKAYVFDPKSNATEVSNPIESIQMAIQFNQKLNLTKEQEKALKEASRIDAISRFNYVNEVAQMIHYKSMLGLDQDDPDFVTPLFTFPVFAVLPKFYLFNISDPGYGYWATQYLSGNKRSSTAISSVGYAYMAGGVGLVIFIFLIIGILMKGAGILLFNVQSVVGFVIFIALMQYLVMFDSVIQGTFINLIRFGLLLPPVLWIFLRK
jgi:hypothetical protein